MIRDLQYTFDELLSETPWMDEKMKIVAKEKLEYMITIMGYPDFTIDNYLLDKLYENLRICKYDHYGNSQRIRAFRFAYQLSTLPSRDRAL